MKRKTWLEYAKKIAADVESKSFDYWVSQEFPITMEATYLDSRLHVELGILEKEADHLLIGVSVGDYSFKGSYCPVGWTVLVRKDEDRSGSAQ